MDKGIFPPASSRLSTFTSQNQWENDDNYNMDNRRLQYQKDIPRLSYPPDVLEPINPDHLPTEGYAFVNTPVTQLLESLKEASMVTTLYVTLQPNKILLTPGFLASDTSVDVVYNFGDNDMTLENMNMSQFTDWIRNNNDLFWSVFTELNMVYDRNSYVTVEQLKQDVEQVQIARLYRRLVRR